MAEIAANCTAVSVAGEKAFASSAKYEMNCIPGTDMTVVNHVTDVCTDRALKLLGKQLPYSMPIAFGVGFTIRYVSFFASNCKQYDRENARPPIDTRAVAPTYSTAPAYNAA